MKKYVHVLTGWYNYEGSSVLGVFALKKLAKEALKNYKKEPYYKYDGYEIVKFKLNIIDKHHTQI